MNDYIELGAIGILFLAAIREFFSYLKSKNSNGLSDQILEELKSMNTNHLQCLKEAIESGNRRLIDSQHQDNIRIIELLGEIKGQLK